MGDRLVIIWDNKRLKLIGEPEELDDINNGTHRSPLVARFQLRSTSVEFLFMVNHLARTNTTLRREQATKLSEWVGDQLLPVIAVGDYNFDYSVDEGKGNQAMKNMLSSGAWKWVRPDRLSKTQLSARYNGVLDFVFVANKPDAWKVDSRILKNGYARRDDAQRSDHRALEGRVLIPR